MTDRARIPDAVHEELLNWSRWCWLGAWPHPLPPTHCGSLEAQYRAPLNVNFDESQEAPPPPRIRPNERHARMVQETWEKLPNFERLVLKAEYPGRESAGRNEGRLVAARRLGIDEWAYDRHLQSAVLKVQEAFRCYTQGI